MKKEENAIQEENIDYNVFNALNLYNEDLGQAYIKDGFNPFDSGFVLNEQFVTDVLANSKEEKEVATPPFLEQSQTKINQAFDMSLENATKLLESLSKKASAPELSKEQKQLLNKLIVQLKMYIELLRQYKIKQKKEKNKYQLYVNLLSLNWVLSEQMAQSFTSEFNLQNTLDKINEMQQSAIDKESEAIRRQAREIIANNQKILAEKQNEQTEQTQQEQNQQTEQAIELSSTITQQPETTNEQNNNTINENRESNKPTSAPRTPPPTTKSDADFER